MATKRVRKAVFPVGGLGTRFLPATKSLPKEMLTVVDKPIIHYAFEEARDAGIEEFIFIMGRNKNAISNHFDHSYELENILSEKNKTRELDLTRGWMPSAGSIVFTRQQAPLGLGHAVWCARHLIGDEPFAVILADDMVLSETPCIKQMIDAHQSVGGNMVAVAEVARENTSKYGILDIKEDKGNLVSAKGLVEKPDPSVAPSNLAIIGRYILQPDIFEYLEKQERGSGGEIQLTDAMAAMLATTPFHGLRYEGHRYDCGNRVGFLEANIAFALARDDMRERVQKILRNFCDAM
jgi:UTP--glucose-1-phosphate uridylyltransferase